MKYRREVDGLRALAVLPVILFHAGFSAFSGGFVGVDVFFVISGYLITSIILAELQEKRFSIINFYERRARRILPALFVVMFVTALGAWLWLLPTEMKSFSHSVVAVCLFVSNFEFFRTSGYFDAAAPLKPLLHTWSLAVEEQYYVFFPLFLMMMWRWGKRSILIFLAVIAVISLALAQWGAIHQPTATFYLLPTRGWELLIGAFIAFYTSSPHPLWTLNHTQREIGGSLGLALLLVSIFTFTEHLPFPGLYALVPTVGTALIILCASSQTWVGKLLSNRLLVGIGLISYSAYLWHQPLFAFARIRSIAPPSPWWLGTLGIVALLLAYFSWRFIEKPFRTKNQPFHRRHIFMASAIVGFAFIAFGILGHKTNGFVKREPPAYLPADYFQHAALTRFDNMGIDGHTCVSETATICRVNEGSAGAKNILLVGDSHSADFSVAYARWVKSKGYGASQISVAGCGYIPSQFSKNGHACEQAVLLLKQTLATKKFDAVIMVVNLYGHTAEDTSSSVGQDMRAFTSLLKDMSSRGTQVWLFAPRYTLSIMPMHAAMLNQIDQIRVRREPSVSIIDDVIRSKDFVSSVRLFDQRQMLLDLGHATADDFHGHTAAHEPLYRDTHHLTHYGAQQVFDKFVIQSGL